jgi:C1A family cysteine protease
MRTAAGIAALAALGLVAVNYSSNEGSQLFLSERITEEEMAYMRYVSEFGKSYGTKAEFKFRLEQFQNTLKKIAEHESNTAHGSTVSHNEFSDWTEAEYKRLHGYKTELRQGLKGEAELLDTSNLEKEVNWKTKGAVTKVKNQGHCGSCWAFSTTGSVEGAMFLAEGKLQSFSEQQLVDCSKSNNGCNGGLMDYAFKYIETAPLETEAEYPYKGKDGHCEYVKSKGVGKVKAFKDVAEDKTGKQLMAALAKGPVSVAIEADQFVFQGYSGGVITHGCGKKLDHGVLAVGYGSTENGDDYFLVKNSWGPSWGVEGYVKIAPSQCGITMEPSYPTEAKKTE